MTLFDKGPPLILHLNLEEEELLSAKLSLNPKKGLLVTTHGKKIPEAILSWLDHYLTHRKSLACDFLERSSLTVFQNKVLHALENLAFGEKASYQAIAERVGSAQSARAVGNCCRVNPFPLFIPCHRVVAKDGSLGGFAYGLAMKTIMLSFEEAT